MSAVYDRMSDKTKVYVMSQKKSNSQNGDEISIFGGTLTRGADKFGEPDLIFAPFKSDEKAEAHYSYFRRKDGFLVCFDADAYERGKRYHFAIRENEFSVSECIKRGIELDSDGVLRELVRIIRNSTDGGSLKGPGYRPIQAISPETVYISSNGQVRILPLYATGDNLPESLPREAGGPGADMTTDLYSAVYLSAWIRTRIIGDSAGLRLPDHPALKGMLLPKGLRPEPEEFFSALSVEIPADTVCTRMDSAGMRKEGKTGPVGVDFSNAKKAVRNMIKSIYTGEAEEETGATIR